MRRILKRQGHVFCTTAVGGRILAHVMIVIHARDEAVSYAHMFAWRACHRGRFAAEDARKGCMMKNDGVKILLVRNMHF